MKAPLLTHYFIKKITKSPRYTILDSLVFDDFILADELFAKALQNFETCVSVNDKS